MKKHLLPLLLLTSFAIKGEPQLNEPFSKKVTRNLRSQNVQFVDVTWSDILGHLKEITIPVSKLESALENDMFFDGSSITGFSEISESDLRLHLDPEAISLSPWKSKGFVSARFFCDVLDTNGKPYKNDPRSLLKSVIQEADTIGYSCLCGTELEFFLFKKNNDTIIPVDNIGYCAAQEDTGMNAFKNALLYTLIHLGVDPEKIHHEVASGQFEVVLSCTDPLTLADRIQLAKHTIKMFALQNNYIATFMPKPINNINGTGMHIHASLKKDGANAFFDASKECFLSDAARSFISGLLKRVPEVNVLFNPEINSSKRLVPGYEAPVFLCSGDKNRSTAIRIPEVTKENIEKTNGSTVRCELRWPDPECNPYLALATLFKAGIEGIENKEAHVDFVNSNLYHTSKEERDAANIKTLPASLDEAITLFEASDFAKDLLGKSLHTNIIKIKRNEVAEYKEIADNSKITNWELARGITL